MKARHVLALATVLVVALLALAGAIIDAAKASVVGPIGSGRVIMYASEAAAKSPDGLSSFIVSPGQSMTFRYPTGGAGNYDEISVVNTPNFGKKFNVNFYDYEWVWKRVQYYDYKWTWDHYAAWGGQNSCSTVAYHNDQWSNGQGVLWHYQGAGSYVVNQFDACTWWGGRQGHYAYCPISFGCIQDDWPWNTNQYFGWGDVRIYAYGR